MFSYLSYEIERPFGWYATPSPRLRPYVDRYCGFTMPRSMPLSFGQRSSPSGNVTLFFAFGSGQICETKHAYKPDGVVKNRPKQAIILPKDIAWRVTLEETTDVVNVRLRAGMAAPFLNLSLLELSSWARLDEIWSHCAIDQLSQLDLVSIQDRVQLIERVLLQRLEQSTISVDPTVNQAIHLIQKATGRFDIQTLADQLHISTRQLRRKFQHHVGFTPKQYSKIARFRYANHLIQHTEMSLTEVAHLAGYFDLAHFTHAVQEVAGITPSEMSKMDRQAQQLQKQDSDFISLSAF
ncbi:MAG: helix-turn-helix transcriptional regulator [Chloroflexota bacterium]